MDTNHQIDIRERYDRDGYIFLPGFLNSDETGRIRATLEAFISGGLAGMQPGHVFYENKNDPATLKQLQDLHTYDPFFHDLLFASRFREIAGILLDDRPVGRNLEYFNKPPMVGKPTPPHQDNFYFMLNPPVALTMWLALETADEENGCVRYIPGSHRKGLRPHGKTQTLGFSQGISDYGEHEDLGQEEIAFPAKAGDLLIHHAMTIHRADGNRTASRSRKAVGFIYFGESAKEDLEAKNAYRQQLDKERMRAMTGN